MKNASFRIAILLVMLAYAHTAALSQNDGTKPLTNSDVISMVKAGLTDDTITSAIDAQPSKFDISAAALLNLKKQGASAKLIDAMVSASRREQSPSGAPASTAAGSSTTGEKSPEALRAEESQDPRLKQMSAKDRQYILDQGAYAVDYCKNNATLNGLYSCSCFSEKMVDARIKTNGERVVAPNAVGSSVRREPFTNLIFKVDYRDCADPAKAEKYGSDRAYQVLKMDTQLSRPQIDQICACVGSSVAGGFKANPVPNMEVIDGMFTSALVPCREKAVGGGSSASAPQASSNQAQPAAQSAPQTARRQPAPAPQRGSILDRFKQAQNRANDAIRGTTGTNPPQPSNQSPQSAPAPSGVTSQQPNATAPSPSASSTSSAGSSGRLFYHLCGAGGATRTEGGGIQAHKVPMPLYMSDIYPVPMDKNINHADGVAFGKFLSGKYDPYFDTNGVSVRSCGGNFTTLEAAQAGKQKQEDAYRKNASLLPSTFPNSNVIETGWKWTGAEPSQ